VGKTAGSFAAALVPAAFFFLRPTRVVGRGGGSYLGLSFYHECQKQQLGRTPKNNAHLLILSISPIALLTAAHSGLLLTL
jgi:hypothetical protein